MSSTIRLFVPFACVAMGLLVALSSGCRKEREATEGPAKKPPMATVEERMADKDYVKKLDAQRDEMKRLAKQLHAATNDAERKAAAKLLEVNRLRTAEIIRTRMAASKKELSK